MNLLSFLPWLRKPRNPMLSHPGYAVMTQDIERARREHKPTKHLVARRTALIHRALARGKAA